MKSNQVRFFIFRLTVCILSAVLMGTQAFAQGNDGKAMLSQINTQLRQAEKDMFAGETGKAVAALETINRSLTQVAAADPDNSGVKAAQKKHTALVKGLELRTGNSLGSGAGKAVEPAQAPAGDGKRPSAASAKVPYAARKPLADALQRLDSLERNLGDLADPAYAGDKDQLVQRAEEKLIEIRGLLAEAKKLASEKGVDSHPDIEKGEAGLAAAEKKVALDKGRHEKNKGALTAKSKLVDAEVAALKVEYDRVVPVFEGANGAVPHYNDLKPVAELIARIEAFEKGELPGITRKMQAFAQTFGTTREEIDRNAGVSGYSGQQRASFPYTALAEGIEKVKKTRTVMAEDLVSRASEQFAHIGNVHDFHVAEQLAETKTWFAMAGRYQADNPKVKEAQAGVDRQIEQAVKVFNARIDTRTWPGQAPTAPSNGKQLSRIALDWFKNSPDWGQNTKQPRVPLAVVVTGPWSVQQKNILGEPTLYGLPVLLAVRVDGDKELDVARAFALTLRTAEKAGVKMEPPFDHVTVGDSFFIRPAAIK